MFEGEEERRNILTDDFEGVLYTKGDIFHMGSFSGLVYHAEIETGTTQEKMTFLVSERGRGAFTLDEILN